MSLHTEGANYLSPSSSDSRAAYATPLAPFPTRTHWDTGSLWVSPVISDRPSFAFIQRLITASKTSGSSPSGEWEDQCAFKKWLVSKNCWPKALLLLIIGFFTLSVLGNHWRVMMYYIAWKTSLSTLCRSDSVTYHFLLMNKTVLLRVVVTEYTECFLSPPNNNSAAMLSNQNRETDPALNFVWFQLSPQRSKKIAFFDDPVRRWPHTHITLKYNYGIQITLCVFFHSNNNV